MNSGRTIFSQLMDFMSKYEFDKLVDKYQGNRKIKTFSCWDQFLALCFAQLTNRESLRSIETCLNIQPSKLYHLGFRCIKIDRSTLAKANENRDWHIFADFANSLIKNALPLYRKNSDFAIEIKETAYAFDSTTIDLCLNLFPWAKFRSTKGGIKLHTLLNLRGDIPTFIEITEALLHDVNALDILITEPNVFYVLDKGYIDFARLYKIHQAGSFFVIRAKKNLKFRRIYSHAVDKTKGLRCDQTICLTVAKSAKDYPQYLRRIKFFDKELKRSFVFLTNNFAVDSFVITQLYKERWSIELFFKWIKQHLNIKHFYGTSLNAVKTQIWVAVCIYVLVSIIKAKLKLQQSIYTILQILSLQLFEKTPIKELFTKNYEPKNSLTASNQLTIF